MVQAFMLLFDKNGNFDLIVDNLAPLTDADEMFKLTTVRNVIYFSEIAKTPSKSTYNRRRHS